MNHQDYRAAIMFCGMMAVVMDKIREHSAARCLRLSQLDVEREYYNAFKEDKYFIEE